MKPVYTNDLFLRACRREPVERLPVWYMRQAGRSQPEYREIKKRYSLLEITEQPKLCAEVTRLPVTQLGVDAAILFSDIMVPLGPMGIAYDIQKDVGPVVANPLRNAADVRALRELNVSAALPHVLETISMLAADLPVPLIGFAGGPFTLASYMIEGQADLTRKYERTKAMMHERPADWHELMKRLVAMIVTYMQYQLDAGAAAIQIFDSWVGSLDEDDFTTYVLPHLRDIFAGLQGVAPTIYFGLHTTKFFAQLREAGPAVLGVDWHTSISAARALAGPDVALQGNLDPATVLGSWDDLEREARAIIEQGVQTPGFIFNLGHGVQKESDPAVLTRLTQTVHTYSEELLRQKVQ
ncbi:MAG: uroporphyrinogen decarboxylase [Firmicutes bacterium]|nr:uroporphyrinogen decarboxylase [Bacillota bacterium]